MLTILEQINSAGRQISEDRVWHHDNCVVVFDGSTGLGASDYDANWLIDRFLEVFEPAIASGHGMLDAINEGIDHLAKTYYALVPQAGAAIPPSAAAIFLQQKRGVIEIVSLGDCRCELVGEHAVSEVFVGDVKKLDDRAIACALNLSDSLQIPFHEALKEDAVQEMLRAHRRLMNVEGGYRVLAPNAQHVSESDVITYSAADYQQAIMMTDGFDWMVSDIVAGKKPIEEILKDLRAAEDQDPYMAARPRFKKGDDAAMVRVQISD